jgi:hypothetical protein
MPAKKLTDKDAEDLSVRWKKEDAESHATRMRTLNQMAQIRAIAECLSTWSSDCNRAWDELNANDEKRHNERVQFNSENVGTNSGMVPSLQKYYSAKNPGSAHMNKKPQWFDVLGISTTASKMSWDAAKRGECSVDKSTPGGVAVHDLFSMLTAAKNHTIKQTTSVSASGKQVPFDWDSHDYNLKAQKSAVENALGFGESASKSGTNEYSLPREYENDIECYVRTITGPVDAPAVQPTTASNLLDEAVPSIASPENDLSDFLGSSTSDTNSMLEAATSRVSKLTVAPSAVRAKPTATSGWWSSSSWSN